MCTSARKQLTKDDSKSVRNNKMAVLSLYLSMTTLDINRLNFQSAYTE
jgi:hypothetical protein